LGNEGIDVGHVIEMGLGKLDEYYALTADVPAYRFALSEWLCYL
jgi:hypothetical protein